MDERVPVSNTVGVPELDAALNDFALAVYNDCKTAKDVDDARDAIRTLFASTRSPETAPVGSSHVANRINVDGDETALYVCFGHHERSAPCEVVEFVPRVPAVEREPDGLLLQCVITELRLAADDNGNECEASRVDVLTRGLLDAIGTHDCRTRTFIWLRDQLMQAAYGEDGIEPSDVEEAERRIAALGTPPAVVEPGRLAKKMRAILNETVCVCGNPFMPGHKVCADCFTILHSRCGAIQRAMEIIEEGDRRLTADEGPIGNLPPKITLEEWVELYECLKTAIAPAVVDTTPSSGREAVARASMRMDHAMSGALPLDTMQKDVPDTTREDVEVCEWRNGAFHVYDTACGATFTLGDDMSFCPKCGKPLRVVEKDGEE